MKPGGGRAKGRAFEQEIARLLRAIYPDAKRGLQSRDGSEAPDVIFPGWHFECKRCRRVHIRSAYQQALDDCAAADSPDIPAVISKDDHGPILVTLAFQAFLDLLEKKRD